MTRVLPNKIVCLYIGKGACMTKVIFTENRDISTIGSRIRYAMEKKGMSQAELHRAIGIKSSSMSNLIGGRSKSPSASTLMKLAETLDVSQAWLMDGTGSPSDKRVLVSDAEIHRNLDRLPADQKQAIAAAIEAMILTSKK